MAINQVLELYLERRKKIKREQKQYETKCKELGLSTDEEALEKVIDTINSSSLSDDEKEVISNYIYTWYGCYENEYL